jgi:plasmid stabilization system protein ParE
MAAAAVRFHPAAAQEAESTYDWYAARDLAAAHGFREELREAIEAVAADPRTWPRYGSRTRRYVLPRYPFSLVYILRAADVEVVAVAHGRRRPDYWRSRL